MNQELDDLLDFGMKSTFEKLPVSRETAKAGEESYQEALDNFGAMWDQAYVGLYMLVSAFDVPQVTQRGDGTLYLGAYSLYNRDPTDVVESAFIDFKGKEITDFYESGSDMVLVLEPTRPLPLTFNFFTYGSVGNNDSAVYEEILTNIFPSFKMNTSGRWLRKFSTKDVENVDWKPNDPVSEDGNYGTGHVQEMWPAVSKFISMDYELLMETMDFAANVPANIIKDSFDPSIKLDKDFIAEQRSLKKYNFRHRVHVKFKKEFLAWATNSADPSKVNKAAALLFMQAAYRNYAVDGYYGMSRFESANSVSQRLVKMRDMSDGFKPRVNARGYSIMPNGNLFHFPEGSETGEVLFRYEKDADEALTKYIENREGKEAQPLNTVLRELNEEYRNTLAVVDWVNDRAVMSLTGGPSAVMDISSAIPLDVCAESDLLNTRIVDNAELLSNVFKQAYNFAMAKHKVYHTAQTDQSGSFYVDREDLIKVDPEFYEVFPTVYQPEDRLARTPPQIFTALASNNDLKRDIRIKHLFGIDLEELEDSPTYERDVRDLNYMHRVLNYVRANYSEAETLVRNFRTNEGLQGYHYFVNVGGDPAVKEHYTNVTRAAAEERERTRLRLGDANKVLELPNIEIREGVFEALMPHQAECSEVFDHDPKNIILDVSAGGGKTILLLINALMKMKRGNRRTLVVTSGDLIPSMITEGNAISNGKLNFISLRVKHLEHLLKVSNITTAVEFIRWIRSLPENTIFLTSYTDFTSTRVLFDDWDVPISYFSYQEGVSQYAQIMKAIHFQTVQVDESHKIKNPDAARSTATAAMLARANSKTLASGTLISNTVLDMQGQATAINPAIFGDQDKFITDYGIENGILTSAIEGSKIRDRLRGYTALVTKRKSDWSFLLPDIDDHFVAAEMTENQTAYYNLLLEEALIEVHEALMELEAKGKSMDADELERRIEVMLKAALAKVEQFMLDPTSQKEYVSWSAVQLGEADFVSPKVYAVNQVLREHFAKDDGKVIVFSTLKVGSKHQMMHSAYSNQAVHYTAGDLEAIRRFKEDPNVKVMFADATSMKEGHNLQMASAVISIQSVWAPGDFEQYLSRMYRPDPRGKYNRKMIDHYWIMLNKMNGAATLDSAKIARFISKSISNAHVSNDDSVEWLRVAQQLGTLPIIKMNTQLISEFTHEDAGKYFRGWQLLKRFEQQKNRYTRQELGRKLEQAHNIKLLDDNGNVIDVREFLKYAMRPIKEGEPLPGSRKVYTPWVAYAEPADPHNLGLELVNDNVVVEGQGVWTEFGPAIIEKVNLKSIKVKASHGSVVLSREAVAYTEKGESEKLIRSMFKQGTYALVPPGLKQPSNVGLSPKRDAKLSENPVDVVDNQITKPRVADIVDTEKDMPAPEAVEEEEVDAEEIDIEAAVVNGLPALVSQTRTDLLNEAGWRDSTPFVQISFVSWRYAEDFLTRLENKFHVAPRHAELLYRGIEDMKVGRSMRVSTLPNAQIVKNFFLDTRRKLPAKDGYSQAKPYWVSWNTKPRLLFDISAHSPDVLQWLARSKRIPGVKSVTKNDGFYIKFFRTMTEARDDIVDTMRKLKGRAAFDRAEIKNQLQVANKLLKEMKLNTKNRS